MKFLRKILLWILGVSCVFILICNFIVVSSSKGKCYTSADSVPNAYYGILLGTGRSSAPSPYYDARVNAAIDLLKAQKIDILIISGENQYPDYHEVDSMAADILAAVPDAIIQLDFNGVDTYASLKNTGDCFGYHGNYTLISQHFHNQRALFYTRLLFSGDINAYDASDTKHFSWRARNIAREWFARVKAVLMLPIFMLG